MTQSSVEPGTSRSRALRSAVAPHRVSYLVFLVYLDNQIKKWRLWANLGTGYVSSADERLVHVQSEV